MLILNAVKIIVLGLERQTSDRARFQFANKLGVTAEVPDLIGIAEGLGNGGKLNVHLISVLCSPEYSGGEVVRPTQKSGNVHKSKKQIQRSNDMHTLKMSLKNLLARKLVWMPVLLISRRA